MGKVFLLFEEDVTGLLLPSYVPLIPYSLLLGPYLRPTGKGSLTVHSVTKGTFKAAQLSRVAYRYSLLTPAAP